MSLNNNNKNNHRALLRQLGASTMACPICLSALLRAPAAMAAETAGEAHANPIGATTHSKQTNEECPPIGQTTRCAGTIAGLAAMQQQNLWDLKALK